MAVKWVVHYHTVAENAVVLLPVFLPDGSENSSAIPLLVGLSVVHWECATGIFPGRNCGSQQSHTW